MRALPRIMAARRHAQIVIVGGDGVSYGATPPTEKTWKSTFFNEVADHIDQKRVHLLGRLSYREYISVLQYLIVTSISHILLCFPGPCWKR